ncbi:MAG: hypothetical protein COA62_14460 [Rhodobiaceae bacterium]|nr:MAG: hypothetical protein COA62_14460 [Rhodobiaceae bacterium]
MRTQSIEFKWFFSFVLGLFLVLGTILWAWPARAAPAGLEAGIGTVSAPLAARLPLPRPNVVPRSTPITPVSRGPASSSPSGRSGQLLPRIMNVVILGDSLGDGLWAGLYRELKADGRFNIIKHSKVSTGFVRRDYYDWNARVEQVLDEEQVDIAVIMIGTNDRQVLVDDEGHRHSLRAPGWEAAYKDRIDRFTTSLTQRGVLVYWVGLPVMRSPRFGRDMQYFNSIYEDRAAANGIPYIPTWNDLTDGTGAYSAYGQDTRGRRRLLRADDGIHFTLAGYRVLAAVVADDLVSDRDAGIAPGDGKFIHRSSVDTLVPNYVSGHATMDPVPDAPVTEPLVASSIEEAPAVAPVLRPGRADDWRWPRL